MGVTGQLAALGRESGLVTGDEYQPVAVSRRICAPAREIFQVLADPVRHPEFDGSQMLRGAVSTAVISAVGDVFVMKMYYSEIGDYEIACAELCGLGHYKMHGMVKVVSQEEFDKWLVAREAEKQ